MYLKTSRQPHSILEAMGKCFIKFILDFGILYVIFGSYSFNVIWWFKLKDYGFDFRILKPSILLEFVVFRLESLLAAKKADYTAQHV